MSGQPPVPRRLRAAGWEPSRPSRRFVRQANRKKLPAVVAVRQEDGLVNSWEPPKGLHRSRRRPLALDLSNGRPASTLPVTSTSTITPTPGSPSAKRNASAPHKHQPGCVRDRPLLAMGSHLIVGSAARALAHSRPTPRPGLLLSKARLTCSGYAKPQT